jgi:hypothetical protein
VTVGFFESWHVETVTANAKETGCCNLLRNGLALNLVYYQSREAESSGNFRSEEKSKSYFERIIIINIIIIIIYCCTKLDFLICLLFFVNF